MNGRNSRLKFFLTEMEAARFHLCISGLEEMAVIGITPGIRGVEVMVAGAAEPVCQPVRFRSICRRMLKIPCRIAEFVKKKLAKSEPGGYNAR